MFVKMKGHTCIFTLVWVLVFDLEENKHSPPILLEEVQDKSGRNGEEAGLKKHDKARYEEGGKLQEAFIVSLSGKFGSHLVASMVHWSYKNQIDGCSVTW